MQEKKFLEKAGKQIARYRKERKMTQQKLADLCEMERSALARLEGGTENLTLITLFKLSKALNVPLSEFFDFEY